VNAIPWYDKSLKQFHPFQPLSGKKGGRGVPGHEENIKREDIKSIPPYGLKWVE
jgi:hypothetical protein